MCVCPAASKPETGSDVDGQISSVQQHKLFISQFLLLLNLNLRVSVVSSVQTGRRMDGQTVSLLVVVVVFDVLWVC